jgi:hypothetical protein
MGLKLLGPQHRSVFVTGAWKDDVHSVVAREVL